MTGTVSRPVSRTTLLLAGALDQLLFLGIFLAGLGAGLLLAQRGEGSSLPIGLGIGAGIVGALVCLFVQIRLAVRSGSTVGLFLVGCRFDPATPVDWYDDAVDWLLLFWRNLLLAPVDWLFARFSRRDRDGRSTGFIRDPRALTGAGRVWRAVLAVLLIASPLPLVLAFAT